MNKFVQYTSQLCHQLQAAWRSRRVYRSGWEAWRALGLRLVAIRSLRKLAPAGNSPLRLRGLDSPLYVRRATSDFWVLEEIYENGEYAAVKRLKLPEDATILDLGANIGLASHYFATLYPRCRIVAVEPDRANCQMIEFNCRKLLDQGRMRVVNAFIAAESGMAAIDRTYDSYGFIKRAPDGRPAEELIECVTVEGLLDRIGSGSVDLLKCDIEGSEKELFAACRRWVGRVCNTIVETHAPYSLPELYAHLRAAGWPFEVVWEDVRENRSLALLRRTGPTDDRQASSNRG